MDAFHANNQRLYQVMSHIKLPDGIHTQQYTPAPLARALAVDMPEIEYVISVQPGYTAGTLSAGEKHVKAIPEFVDQDFFKVFSYNLLQGNKNQPFPDKHAVLLSDELAMRLFHTTRNIIGRTVQWSDDPEAYAVSGIFEKPGANSSAQFDMLLDFRLYFEKHIDDLKYWENSSPYTYLVLKNETRLSALNKKITGYLQTKSSNSPLTLSLRRYADQYLYGTYQNGVQAGGRIQYVRLFTVVAIFILVMACVNFMNLSTARASRRLKEVGIKKVMGARRGALIGQYLGESVGMALLALVFALGWVFLLLPQFNHIAGKSLGFHMTMPFVFPVLTITLLTGLAAGIYPAFYLSGFEPVGVLKGMLRTSWSELMIRKGLVVFQYALSALFIISVLVIYNQMNFVQTINLGYNKDHVISFNGNSQLNKVRQPFLTDLKKIPRIAGVSTLRGDLTGNPSGSTEKLNWEGKPAGQKLYFIDFDVDYDLLDLLGIKMESGRNFSRDMGSDSLSILLNRAAVDAMGLEDPIGKTVSVWGSVYHIIGITGNFHFESLYEQIKPSFIRCVPGGQNILVRLKAGQEHETLSKLNKLYHDYIPELPLEYSFLDQDYQAMYIAEQRVAILSRYFAGLAVIISSLGLLGLAAFTAQKRKKEIGIRKVIGATVGNLVFMLSADFLKLLLIALAIAFPLSWWLLQDWLEGFAYHVHITAGIFVLAGLSVIAMTVVAIGFQSVRAARVNPINSLRTE